MEEKWKIVLYKNPQGEALVNEFILSLKLKTQAKIYNAIRLLKTFGVHVGSPHIKKLTETQLWELRF